MSAKPTRRFYKEVGVGGGHGGFVLRLDGKAARTPHRALLVLPTHGLANAVADEWRAQGDMLDLSTLRLTQLAYAALDRVAVARGKVIDRAMGFGRSDLLCYRAEAPAALAIRQKEIWDPLLEWARETCGLRLNADAGIAYIEQPADAQLRLQELTSALDDFTLAAFDVAATAVGSFVLALALVRKHIGAHDALAAAQLDETYQAETWGCDPEAEARRAHLLAELISVEVFLHYLAP